ncbi:MAG TPA: biotin-dependent carboxyltransferase family protein, partial [Thermaerobacter sp.]
MSQTGWLEVLHGGLLTTVQDGGRPGLEAAGLSAGGAMDRFLLACANALVGNPPDAAALEFTLDGPVLAARGDVVMAVVAAGASWYAGEPERPLPLWESVLVRDGSVVVVGAVTAGVRGYVAVAGGVDVPAVLGSRSTHLRARLGGLGGRPLTRGDRIPVGRPERPLESLVGRWLPPELRPHRRSAPIRVMLGPEADRLTRRGLRTLLRAGYRATALSDRMGLRLQGPPVEAADGYDILSEPLAEGTVQVARDGQPIVLLAERQTTGGYLRVATVIRADLDVAGQIRPGQLV